MRVGLIYNQNFVFGLQVKNRHYIYNRVGMQEAQKCGWGWSLRIGIDTYIMLENKHPAFERHPQNNSIMPEIMFYKQHYAQLRLRLYLMRFSIPADLNTKFYCISYKFRTGSHDGQTISQSQQPNKMMQRCKKTLRSSNQAFQHANSH